MAMFDKDYNVEDGIVNCLPPTMQGIIEPDYKAKHFFEVHDKMHKDLKGWQYAENKEAMANLQREFYDRMAVAFEGMDNADKAAGGVFWWKIHRLFEYDNRLLSRAAGRKLLFIGAGNCRLAALFQKRGWDVVATDISRQMLKVGRDREGATMVYVAHNAEERFPFESNYFDAVYSLCVMNHIVDWKNYISEKIRCIKPGGLLLERMPNTHLWKFWRNQGPLYDGIEVRALDCYPVSVWDAFKAVNMMDNRVYLKILLWTHDKQQRMVFTSRLLRIQKLIYRARCAIEDMEVRSPETIAAHPLDEKGIYTMVLGDKLA